MNIRRFVAADMRSALQLVRQAHGPDAVILSNRRTDEGVEIVAASNYDEGFVQRALDDAQREAVSNAARQPAAAPVAAGDEEALAPSERWLRALTPQAPAAAPPRPMAPSVAAPAAMAAAIHHRRFVRASSTPHSSTMA